MKSLSLFVSMVAFVSLEISAAEPFKIDRSVMNDKYWQVWNDEVQKRIDDDIEKYRKADAEFEVEAPVGAEVKVEQLTHAFFFGAHIFNFNQLGKKEWNDRYKALYDAENGIFNSGTVAFYWRTLERYPFAPRFSEAYEDTEEYWNSLPQDVAMREPHWRRPAPDPVISHLKTQGCRIHGHPLVWGNNEWHTPTWLWDDFCPADEKFALAARTGVVFPARDITLPMGVKNFKTQQWGKTRPWNDGWKKIFSQISEQEVASLIPSFVKAQNFFYEKRIREIGERYGSRVDSWDVVNESATDWAAGAKRKWPAGESSAVNSLPVTASVYGMMPANYAYQGLVLARKYMKKDAWLNVNEYNMTAFPGQIADLKSHGADFDVVGSQMHLFNPKESANIRDGKFSGEVRGKIMPDSIAGTFRRVTEASGGKPIHLSEITITAPDNTAAGQMVQAIIMRNCYRAWFAVEKMSGITWWNVVDNCGAPGEPSISGIFTRDMQPKAAYFAMNDLVNREWKTRLAVKAAGEGGVSKVAFRGFRGRYRLSWTGADGKKRVKFVEVK